jgi:hypothetical protein
MNALTVLYTWGLRGDLHLMTRLATFLDALRTEYSAPLLADLGEACDQQAWHCAATEGRSALVVLDGMGYHAANVAGALTPQSRQRLADVTTMALVDEQHAWRYHVPPVRDEGIIISSAPTPALSLNIVLAPQDATRLEQGTLFLARPAPGEVGVVALQLLPTPVVLAAQARQLPAHTRPHPVVAAAVEFVLEEAAWYGKRQS